MKVEILRRRRPSANLSTTELTLTGMSLNLTLHNNSVVYLKYRFVVVCPKLDSSLQ